MAQRLAHSISQSARSAVISLLITSNSPSRGDADSDHLLPFELRELAHGLVGAQGLRGRQIDHLGHSYSPDIRASAGAS